jgi:peptide/nickel transport system substrate-binding protein
MNDPDHNDTHVTTRRDLLAAIGLGTVGAAALPSDAAAQGAPRKGGTLKVSVSVRCAILNPLKLSSLSEYMSADMLYSGLTRMGFDMRPIPDLATEWSANADATEFVFKLRQGVFFHHGEEFTSADVVATVKAVLDPKTGSPARAAIGPIDEVIAVDKHTVRFKLKSPFADLPVSVGHPNARIVPASWLGNLEQLDTKASGTGPFKLESYDSSRLLKVVRYEKYHHPGVPHVDAIEQYLFPDLAAEAANYLRKQTDVMLDVPQADFKRISSAQGSVGKREPTGRIINIVMRLDQKPFDDMRVRRALAMAIDREAAMELVLEGFGRVSWDNAVSPEYRYFIETPKTAYDPAGARKLLAEAGYPNGIKLPLICSNRPPIRTQFGVAIKEMLRPAGFDIDVQTIPHDNYLANVWRKGNFYIGYWNMRPTEDSMYTLLFTSDAPFADSAWNSKKFDDLVAEARRTTNDAERRRIYAEAQRLMTTELPYIIPFFQDVLTAHQDYVKNYRIHPLQLNFFFDQVWLERS